MVLLLDWWSKKIVEGHFANRSVSWGGVVRIRLVRYLRDASQRTLTILLWFAALASALTLYRMGAAFRSHSALIGLGSALGGAAGNLRDIWRRRPIIDFIDLRWWPVFNVADVAITVGIVLAFWPHR